MKKISSSKISYYSPPPTSPTHTGGFSTILLTAIWKTRPHMKSDFDRSKGSLCIPFTFKTRVNDPVFVLSKKLECQITSMVVQGQYKNYMANKKTLWQTLPGFKQVISHNFAIPVIILHWYNFTDQDLNWQFAIRICNHFLVINEWPFVFFSKNWIL